MATTPIPRDFRELIALLNEKSVKYLVIGGYAVTFHGYPRATHDIDFFVELSRANAEALMQVLDEFGFSTKSLKPEFFMDKSQAVWFGREPHKVEILNDISGVSFAECFKNRVKAKLGGLTVNFISLPDLIANKKASGRLKDLADLDYLPKVPAKRKKAIAKGSSKSRRQSHQ
jgi:predicted nucleotidyltransferase